MGLNAVLQYTKGLLDQLPSPLLEPLKAQVKPPVLEDVALVPFAFIWTVTMVERRQTAPRAMGAVQGGPLLPGGYQKTTWKVKISVTTVIDGTDPQVEQRFPTLFDAIVKKLNTATIATVVTTPVTLQQTQILTIAENVSADVALVTSTSGLGEGMIRFATDITVDVTEKVSWTEGVVG